MPSYGRLIVALDMISPPGAFDVPQGDFAQKQGDGARYRLAPSVTCDVPKQLEAEVALPLAGCFLSEAPKNQSEF